MSLLMAFFVMLYAATALIPPSEEEGQKVTGLSRHDMVLQSINSAFAPRLSLWTGPDRVLMTSPQGQVKNGESLNSSIMKVFRANLPHYKPGQPPLTMQGTYYYEFDQTTFQHMAEDGTLADISSLIHAAPDNWRVDAVVYSAQDREGAAMARARNIVSLLEDAGLKSGQMSIGVMNGQAGQVGLYIVPRTSLYPQGVNPE